MYQTPVGDAKSFKSSQINLKLRTDNKAQYHTAHYTERRQQRNAQDASRQTTQTEGNSPHLPKPLTSIPNPTTRARSPITALLLLRRIPHLHRFRDSSRLVRSVPRESRGDGAVEDVAGDCGVESGDSGLVSS